MKARLLRFGEPVPDGGPQLVPYVDPKNVDIVVLEDDSGKIIARLGVYRISMLEGLWIDEKHRGNPGVVRALLRNAYSIPYERGEKWVFGSAGNDEMRSYLDRLGVKLEADFYSLPIVVGGNDG